MATDDDEASLTGKPASSADELEDDSDDELAEPTSDVGSLVPNQSS